jgi:ketosteroid isomerase-like protein
MSEFSYNIFDEVFLNEERKPGDSPEPPAESRDIDDFFQRLPGNFRWPKPNAEAVAAAVEAIQRISGGAAVAQELASTEGAESDAPQACAGCGAPLLTRANFCVRCGLPKNGIAPAAVPQSDGVTAQHHIHHHYHHVVPGAAAPSTQAAAPDSAVPRGRVAASGAQAPGGRAELAARQVVQDWAQACNTRHIDDLVELYAPEATVIRPSVPPVRSLPAIREFLLSMLEAGLGEVEMESLRLEVMGDIAMDLGRCKMLVPVAMGKRREERGKYLVVLVRQPVGTWKILADSWSTDLPVAAPPVATAPAHDAAPRKAGEPVPAARKPR